MQKRKSSRLFRQQASGLSLRRNRKSRKRVDETTPIHPLLQLQQTIGNQAVGKLIQAKLKVGRPGDKYEQEADRVANTVVSMPESQVHRQPEEKEEEELQTKPLAEQITPLVQRQDKPEEEEKKEELAQAKLESHTEYPVQRQAEEEEEEEEEPIQARLLDGTQVQRQEEEPEEEEEEPIQTKQVSGKTPHGSRRVEARIHSLKGGGQPLPRTARDFFEPRFGRDFSQVRVHTDSQAAGSARVINAQAFTMGRNMVFGAGQYAPETSKGRRLLAHELTHVVQQNGLKSQWNPTVCQLHDKRNWEADQVVQTPELQLQQQPDEELPPLVPIREPAIMDVSDDLVYMVSNRRAVIRTAPPDLSPMRKRRIPWDSQVKITKRYVKDSKSYVYVKKAYGDKSDWGWTLEDNLDVSDVPSEDRYGCLEPFFYFIKNDKYLQPQTIYALAQIDNPIEITKGEVTEQYHLVLTECMYPSMFTHKSKGHYTGHCVDITFTGEYGGEAKKEIEKQGKKAFLTKYKGTIKKHYNHFHGCVSLPSWVSSRSRTRLKELLRERKDEY